MFLSFWTDMQTVHWSADPDVIWVYTVCHSICIIWTHYSTVETHSSNFRVITRNFLGVRISRKFTVGIIGISISSRSSITCSWNKYLKRTTAGVHETQYPQYMLDPNNSLEMISNLQRATTLEKIDRICSKVIIIPYQLTKLQAPSSYSFWDILFKMFKCSKGHYSRKNWRNSFKSLSGNLLIIPYQLTKFQAPSSNTFRDILLTRFHFKGA